MLSTYKYFEISNENIIWFMIYELMFLFMTFSRVKRGTAPLSERELGFTHAQS